MRAEGTFATIDTGKNMKTIIKGLVVLILLGVFLMQGLIASGWMLAPEGDAKYVLVLGAKIEGEEPSTLR